VKQLNLEMNQISDYKEVSDILTPITAQNNLHNNLPFSKHDPSTPKTEINHNKSN